MGLNDDFFTVDADQGESEQPKVEIDAFKPTNPGDTPELKDDVGFIAVTQENDPTTLEEDMNVNQALEQACVRLRDLELFCHRVKMEGGISQQIAIESIDIIPGLITEDHPKGFYTATPSRTALTHALEEQEQEKKSVFQSVTNAVKAFFARVGQWFKNFLSKFNFGKKKEELLAREQEIEKQRQEQEAKITALSEQIDQLKRAANSTNEEFESQLRQRNEQSKMQAAASKEAGNQASAKIIDLQSQMRVLDDTKNSEIAGLLDEMDKLRRREESSRSARIDLNAKIKSLETLVYRSMCREAFDLIGHQEKEITNDYDQYWADTIASDMIVAKYLFGNGFQNRLQTLKRMTGALQTLKPMAHHIDEVNHAFKEAQQNPDKLKQVISEFNFGHFALPEQVFQRSGDFDKEAGSITAKRYQEALDEMKKGLKDTASAVGEIKFEEIAAKLAELTKTLESGISINANSGNLTEIATAYRMLQGHVAKLLPYITKGAVAQRDLLVLWTRIDIVTPNVTKYGSSPECQKRVLKICNAVAQSISLMESFTFATLKKTVTEILVTHIHQLNR